MSESNEPERPPGGGMMEALRVPRYARIGAVVGVLLAGLVYAVRLFDLLGPRAASGREYPVLGEAGWFLLLAAVLAVTTALLVTTLLTAVRAVRLARREP